MQLMLHSCSAGAGLKALIEILQQAGVVKLLKGE
jgi:hypothetical protein